MIINRHISLITISRNLSIVEKTIKYPPGKRNIICHVCGKRGYKAFQCKNRMQKNMCQNIGTYYKGQTYFFALGYHIVSDKSYLLVDCMATKHMTDKSKFINFDQKFEPGNRFVELADGSRENDLVLKRGNTCIYLHNRKVYICRCILKMLYIYQLLNKIYFRYRRWQKWCAHKFWVWQLIYPYGAVLHITLRGRLYYLKISFLPEMPLLTYILGIKS